MRQLQHGVGVVWVGGGGGGDGGDGGDGEEDVGGEQRERGAHDGCHCGGVCDECATSRCRLRQ